MHLVLKTLRSPHLIKFTPGDTWLTRIAQDLAPARPDSAEITGEISLRLDNAGFVHARGNVSAKATQPCSRCGKDVTLDLETEVKATYRPPYEGLPPRDSNLAADDLDVYFIENGQLDIEVLINDALQCAVPSHVSCASTGKAECDLNSLKSGDKPGESKDPSTSPFAVLQSLSKAHK